MRITAKGQVTIPGDLRRRFGLTPGTEVEIVPGDDGALVRPVSETGRGSALIARLRDQADGGMDADEVLRLTRSE